MNTDAIPDSWESLAHIDGWFLNDDSIAEPALGNTTNSLAKQLCATREEAEAILAYSMLTQLVKAVNKDWEPDLSYSWVDNRVFELNTPSYCIGCNTNICVHWAGVFTHAFFYFQTLEIAEEFKTKHYDLLRKFFRPKQRAETK